MEIYVAIQKRSIPNIVLTNFYIQYILYTLLNLQKGGEKIWAKTNMSSLMATSGLYEVPETKE